MFHPLTVLSPTSRSSCYPTTWASHFLSFSSTAPLSPSLSCPHILLLISIHERRPLQTSFVHFLDIYSTFAIPRILSCFILSILVTPLIHLNTLISATHCDFFTAHTLAGFSCLHISCTIITYLSGRPFSLLRLQMY